MGSQVTPRCPGETATWKRLYVRSLGGKGGSTPVGLHTTCRAAHQNRHGQHTKTAKTFCTALWDFGGVLSSPKQKCVQTQKSRYGSSARAILWGDAKVMIWLKCPSPCRKFFAKRVYSVSQLGGSCEEFFVIGQDSGGQTWGVA